MERGMPDTGMKFRTVVEMPRLARPMSQGDETVMLGSCFAEHMGQRFASYALPTLCNPVGTLYNPQSIWEVVRWAVRLRRGEDGAALPLFEHDGLWHCWLANTKLKATTREACAELMVSALQQLAEGLSRARYLFITLGTNVCYRLQEDGQPVTNCHRQPDRIFREEALSVDECARALECVVEAAVLLQPDVQVLLTVSPYRYRKYSFHGSQLAKATLLLAVDEVCRRHPDVCAYLPVYEIFVDELRDYRFYAADMLHPSEVAVDYVWQRFVDACTDASFQAYLRDYEPVRRALAHRSNE